MSEYITDSVALTHTADRIRAKIGGTDPITWDAATGFGGAVDAILAGATIKILATVEVAEPVSAVEITYLPEWDEYDILLVVPDGLTMSTGEYPRYFVNSERGRYLEGSNTAIEVATQKSTTEVVTTYRGEKYFRNSNGDTVKVDQINKISLKLYYAENTIVSGKVSVGGVKYAEN